MRRYRFVLACSVLLLLSLTVLHDIPKCRLDTLTLSRPILRGMALYGHKDSMLGHIDPVLVDTAGGYSQDSHNAGQQWIAAADDPSAGITAAAKTVCSEPTALEGQDIVGNDLHSGIVKSARECCRRCARHAVGKPGPETCRGWTFDGNTAAGPMCYLKSALHPRRPNPKLLSGPTDCCARVSDTDLLTASDAPARAIGPLPVLAAEMCVVASWWPSIRFVGKVSAAESVATAEHCCYLCARLDTACLGWTYDTVDNFCVTLKTLDSVTGCNTCISARLSLAKFDSPESMLRNREVEQSAGARAHSYAEGVLAAALSKGRAVSAKHGIANNPLAPSRDIVIVCAWRRPAFLLRTLVQLLEAAGSEQHFYLLVLDMHASQTVRQVAEAMPVAHHILHVQPHFFINSGWGNTYAVLEGYRYARSLASQMHSRLVYLVEEDVFVAADFFQFHRTAHLSHSGLHGSSPRGEGPPVSLCANYRQRVCVNTTTVLDQRRIFVVMDFNQEIIGDGADALLEPCRRFSDAFVSNRSGLLPNAQDTMLASMVYAKPVYASIGLSVGLAALDAIVQLATPAYYDDPVSFIERRFYHSSRDLPAQRPNDQNSTAYVGQHLGTGDRVDIGTLYGAPDLFTEQDGVIARLVIELGAVAILPRCPRAFHAGFIGYNRRSETSNDLKGSTLESRYEELISLSPTEMAARTSVPDVVATPMAGYFTPSLHYCHHGQTVQMHKSWGQWKDTAAHVIECGVDSALSPTQRTHGAG